MLEGVCLSFGLWQASGFWLFSLRNLFSWRQEKFLNLEALEWNKFLSRSATKLDFTGLSPGWLRVNLSGLHSLGRYRMTLLTLNLFAHHRYFSSHKIKFIKKHIILVDSIPAEDLCWISCSFLSLSLNTSCQSLSCHPSNKSPKMEEEKCYKKCWVKSKHCHSLWQSTDMLHFS